MAEQSDLVVDRHHLRLVVQKLGSMGVPITGVKESRALELAILCDVAGEGRRDIDTLIADLRQSFALEFANWTPVLGKDRDVGTVGAAGGGARSVMTFAPPKPVGTLPERPLRTGTGVRVAVVDTPAYLHPRLVGHVADPDSLLNPTSEELAEWKPWLSHATCVGDLVLQQAPGATLVMNPVLTGDEGTTSSWELAQLLVRLADEGPDIVNLSLGCSTDDAVPPLVISRAIELLDRTAVVVAAGGNFKPEEEEVRPVWPAALPAVVAVGGKEIEFNHKLPWLDFLAPYEAVGAYVDVDADVAGTLAPRFTAATWRGTSFASASVAGRIASMSAPGTARQALYELREAGDPQGVITRVR